MGGLIVSGAGDDGSDCWPHSAVAAFTEEKPDFCGEGSFFMGETAPLGVEISLNTVDFGVSFGGGVGNGLENLEDVIDGDADGDADFGDLIDAIEGDLIDSGFGDC